MELCVRVGGFAASSGAKGTFRSGSGAAHPSSTPHWTHATSRHRTCEECNGAVRAPQVRLIRPILFCATLSDVRDVTGRARPHLTCTTSSIYAPMCWQPASYRRDVSSILTNLLTTLSCTRSCCMRVRSCRTTSITCLSVRWPGQRIVRYMAALL